MEHRLVVLPTLGSPLARHVGRLMTIAALASAAIACGDANATLVVLSDSTDGSASRVVVALPFDPATLPPPPPAPLPAGRRGDSVRVARTIGDSAAIADTEFQRALATANRAARAMKSLDLRTLGYAATFLSWQFLADSAEALRSRRDRFRVRFAVLSARLGDALAPLEGHGPIRRRAAADSVAESIGRAVLDSELAGGVARLDLDAGTWWIATASRDGALRLPAVRAEARSGGSDTVVVR